MSMNNVKVQGSINNLTGSISNVQSGGSISRVHGSNSKDDKPLLEGNIIGNAYEDLKGITAAITTLAGAITMTDPQAYNALVKLIKDGGNQVANIKNVDDAKELSSNFAKNIGNALLSTYNLTVDDFGNMPLGEMVGNVLSGAWKHPITTYLDVATLGNLAGVKMSKNLVGKAGKIAEADVRVKLAEELTKRNITTANYAQDFVRQINKIENTYSPEIISKGMQAIETIGFNNAPSKLKPVMQDLVKANDTYKSLTSQVGAKMYDDFDFAAKELLAKQTGAPFSKLDTKEFMKTKTYQEALQYVQDNDIRPLFHLKPKLYDSTLSEKLETDILSRKYGTMDYKDASVNLTKKAQEFTDKLVRTKVKDSPEVLNKAIDKYNKIHGTNVKKLDTTSLLSNSQVLNELNTELKKVMLSSGIYLGANVITTTLSILNNFSLDAAAKTLKNLPKFRLVELGEAKTPILHLLSKANNKLYRPIASVDRYLENIALEYIKNYGADKAKFLQSTIPNMVVPSNSLEGIIKNIIPFGTYPVAAAKEVGAHISGKPLKTLTYNQIGKIGYEANRIVQEDDPNITNPDLTKALRSRDDKVISKSTVITPIQAANMFMFGEYGDAIQIPVLTFINKLASGKGDPNVFEVNGRSYRMKDGKIKTQKGDIDLLPAITYVGRNLLGPVNFYNKVLVPMMSNNYIKDETKLVNTMVSDSQYSNMSKNTQKRVVDKAREKLGKKVLGTYEYNYYDDREVSKSVKRQIKYRVRQRNKIQRELSK